MNATISTSNPASYPSLSVPTTQNTAPIIEFRCLYTHDLRRKQKRWQDGLLRFHTFNKRVMVYDVPRNYIGDTHWRDKDPVQDGDEFELDRGVLIQVGEIVGSTEQDLTALLEKRKKATEIPSNGDSLPIQKIVHTAIAPLSRPTQMLRPRPLTAVLGTPRGQIGRALDPSKSPHDLRSEANNQVKEGERSAKRRRTEAESEKMATRSNAKSLAYPTAILISSRVAGKENFETAKLKPTHKDQKPSGSSRGSDERNSIHKRHKVDSYSNNYSTDSRKCGKYKGWQDEAVNCEPIQILSSQEEANPSDRHTKQLSPSLEEVSSATPIYSNAPDVGEKVNKKLSRISRRGSSSSTVEEAESSTGQRKRMKLQIGAQKPRQKLMYRELLPLEPAPLIKDHKEAGQRRPSTSSIPATKSNSKEKSCNRSGYLDKNPQQAGALSNFPKKRALYSGGEDEETMETTKADVHEMKKSKRRVSVDEAEVDDHNDIRHPFAEAVQLPIPKPKPSTHNTDLALSRMDAMLAVPRRSPPIQREEHVVKTFLTKTTDAPTLIPDLSIVATMRSMEPTAPHVETQVPLSQDNQPAQVRTLPTACEMANESIVISSQPPPSGAPDLPTISPPQILNAQSIRNELIEDPASTPVMARQETMPPQPEAPENASLPPQKPLPNFRKPTRRSPLKKATSDMSSIRPAPEAPISAIARPTRQALKPKGGDSTEQIANPWSREVWDLFGCGADGVACGYKEFLDKQGCG
ncbi:uncharacterized protein KY384_000551 [Bacidia gigantensis]|uniref:uncharacterized protein n=1 Tax=Bacidia gigantensis TaxID=2732470 RepID=UPI001D040109|nr:uncharacterized protein KY384_000551 [Bacidia gigantensis]KAG8525791.1 hypothetical protein KY384_000551 [Bacidia gigantensis]